MVCRSRGAAQQARDLVAGFLGRLKLTLHPGKTHVVDLGCDGFDFLGFHFHKRPSRRTGRLVPYAWPSQKAMQTVREKIRQQTERTRLRVDLGELVGTLNRIIRGWRAYFVDWELHEEAGRSRSVRLASAVAVLEEAAGRTRSAAPGRRLRSGSGGAAWPTSIPRDDGVSSLARRRVNVVGKPYEGIPHVRFDVAGSGDQHPVPGATP